jgi:hypothetical protein
MASTAETIFSGITATKTDTANFEIGRYDKVSVSIVGTDTAVATVVIYGIDAGGNNRELHSQAFTADDDMTFDLTPIGHTTITVHITAYTTGTFAAYLNAR